VTESEILFCNLCENRGCLVKEDFINKTAPIVRQLEYNYKKPKTACVLVFLLCRGLISR